MITDNLAPLFDPGAPGVRFRQGTVLTWNANTGENTIDLAGGTLTDVPVLNTSEATALKAGHVVGLLGQGSAWFIIGRVTPPNSTDFAGASVAFDTVHNSATNFSLNTTPTTIVSANLDVPSWADEALVTVMCSMSLRNTAVGGYYPAMVPAITGGAGTAGGVGFGLAPSGHASLNDFNSGTCTYTDIVTSPGATIDVHFQAYVGSGTLPAVSNNTALIDAFAIYRSTV